VIWLHERPANLTTSAKGAEQVVTTTRLAAKSIGVDWREKNYLLLRRGPYAIAAGLDESIAATPHELSGRFVNLFDAGLRVLNKVELAPGSHWFLLNLDMVQTNSPHLLASACKALAKEQSTGRVSYLVEGVAETPAVLLLESPRPPKKITLAGQSLTNFEYSAQEKLLWIRFDNEAAPRELSVEF
jgi:hypothetical protein